MARRGRALLLFALAGASTMLAAASCSLGLDESKIGAGQEAGVLDTNAPDTTAADAGDSGPTPGLPDAATCTKDDDCKATHGCLKGKCDLSRKACVFDVCHETACNAAACDTNAKTCGAAKPYPYKATQFQVGAQVTGRIAAVHPWLFAQTATGILAFNVADTAATTPPPVPVVGLGFVPSQMVVSGSRLYFLAAPTGPGPSRLPLAWIDVPSDPFASKIEAKSVLATYSRPAAEGVGLVARGGDTALLLGPQAQSFPSATVDGAAGRAADDHRDADRLHGGHVAGRHERRAARDGVDRRHGYSVDRAHRQRRYGDAAEQGRHEARRCWTAVLAAAVRAEPRRGGVLVDRPAHRRPRGDGHGDARSADGSSCRTAMERSIRRAHSTSRSTT